MTKTTVFEQVSFRLTNAPKKWLVTGCAGFIGSNLVEKLLKLGQTVVGLDNFSTGYQHNLDDIRAQVTKEQWSRFTFFKGDILDIELLDSLMNDVDYVLHQAALGSVPRSIEDPVLTHDNNISGHLNVLEAARRNAGNVKNVVYAASSSTYGDHPGLPKVEDQIGKPLSPYAVTKYVNEVYADVYQRCYGINTVGLRYFNVFGRRQDPKGAYAAVIPIWADRMIHGKEININGDGETSRDFCYIDNVVQANILAAVATGSALNTVYNIACGDRNTLNDLFDLINLHLAKNNMVYNKQPKFGPFREGDVRHSQADISKASQNLGYHPMFDLQGGLEQSINWYIQDLTAIKEAV